MWAPPSVNLTCFALPTRAHVQCEYNTNMPILPNKSIFWYLPRRRFFEFWSLQREQNVLSFNSLDYKYQVCKFPRMYKKDICLGITPVRPLYQMPTLGKPKA